MKKLICLFTLIFAIVCVFSLTACGQSKKYTVEECFTVIRKIDAPAYLSLTINDLLGAEKSEFSPSSWAIQATKAVKITKISYKYYANNIYNGTVVIDDTSPLNAPILKEYQVNEIIDIDRFLEEFERNNNSRINTIDTTTTNYYGEILPVPASTTGMYNLEIEFMVIE